jgi:hypothetical protein
VVSFAPRPLCPGEITFGTYWIERWVGPRSGLDGVENRKILTYRNLNSDPSSGHPVASRCAVSFIDSATVKLRTRLGRPCLMIGVADSSAALKKARCVRLRIISPSAFLCFFFSLLSKAPGNSRRKQNDIRCVFCHVSWVS